MPGRLTRVGFPDVARGDRSSQRGVGTVRGTESRDRGVAQGDEAVEGVGVLEELEIAGLGVLEEVRCLFVPGLNVVTGESGSGKSLLMAGLALLLGARADPALVRGPGPALLNARFWLPDPAARPDPDPAARPVERDAASKSAGSRAGEGGACDDEEGDGQPEAPDALSGEVVVSREIAVTGRGRVTLQGRTAPVSLLAATLAGVAEVHGQHAVHRLASAAARRALLDAWCGPEAKVLGQRVAEAWREMDRARTHLREQERVAASSARDAADAAAQAEDLEAAHVVEGEMAALEAELERLAHASLLESAARDAQRALAGEEEASGVDVALALAARALAGAVAHDPALGVLADRARSLAAEAEDLARAVREYGEQALSDPGRLDEVQGRVALLRSLARRYHTQPDALVACAREAAARAATLAEAPARLQELRALLQLAEERLTTEVGALSSLRRLHAGRLSAALDRELAVLGMDGARIEVSVEWEDLRAQADTSDHRPAERTGLVLEGALRAVGPHGADVVELRFAPSPDIPARPLWRTASGGELARVMLALRVVLAGADRTPVLVFDEVDAGVGGQAALVLGQRLAELARHHQVIVVTHLAQVAAFGNRHLVVERCGDTTTRSRVLLVEGDDRVAELSRMLGGIEDSPSAQAHARELLGAAGMLH